MNEVSENTQTIEYKIDHKEKFMELWSKTYNTQGNPDWSHILPYYDSNIYFKDSIQEIRGIEEFKAMTERLTQRSKNLEMKIVNCTMDGNLLFFEWEMKLSFDKYPNSVLYGLSRITLNDQGKISEQRDYYDLWGDIYNEIPIIRPIYRWFMKVFFG